MEKTFEYYGIFLNDDSKKKLRQFLSEDERYSIILEDADKIFFRSLYNIALLTT